MSRPNTDYPVENRDDVIGMATHRRPREQYGDIILSVQASAYAYCEPREHCLPIEAYTTVEVALWRASDDGWLVPSDVGFDGADQYWEERSPENQGATTIGAYVPREITDRIREHLRSLTITPPV